MKAEIDERGCLTIEPESPMESYALSRWYENWNCDNEPPSFPSSLCIKVPGLAPGFSDTVYAAPMKDHDHD